MDENLSQTTNINQGQLLPIVNEKTVNFNATDKKKKIYKKKNKPVDNSEINNETNEEILFEDVPNPILISVSEAAKLGGVKTKTIRRAIEAGGLNFKIINNRYLISLHSLVNYFNSKIKLKNKFYEFGLGQYLKDKTRR